MDETPCHRDTQPPQTLRKELMARTRSAIYVGKLVICRGTADKGIRDKSQVDCQLKGVLADQGPIWFVQRRPRLEHPTGTSS